MSDKYKFVNDGHAYFVSFAVIYWIDLFTRTEYCKTVLDSLTHCEKEKGLELYAYCIMPGHIHMIIGSSKDPLEGIMRDFKSFTSRKLKEAIQNHPGESRKGMDAMDDETRGNKKQSSSWLSIMAGGESSNRT